MQILCMRQICRIFLRAYSLNVKIFAAQIMAWITLGVFSQNSDIDNFGDIDLSNNNHIRITMIA